MKRMTTIVLKLLTLLLILTVALCSCDTVNSLLEGVGITDSVIDDTDTNGSDEQEDDKEQPHYHTYVSTVTPATCTEAGKTTYKCECGDSYVSNGSAPLGHSYVDGICSVCKTADPDYKQPEGSDPGNNQPGNESDKFDYSTVPAYTDKNYVEIHGNVPYFTKDEITSSFFESYSDLDALGRVGVALACLGRETLPTDTRGSLSYNPTGWVHNNYSTNIIPQTQIYNRSHLIAWALSGENNNEKNLMTGTPYFNQIGMQIFETMVLDYIKETGNHVMYRVTPVFVGNNLLANGALMEAWSVEDNGDGICFCVFMYNVQPGVILEYETGNNYLPESDKENVMSATLVTDLSQIKEGDKIIIVANGANYALGGKSNSGNNMVAIDIEKDGNTVHFGDDVSIITLEKGKTEGTYALSVSDGYLYSASAKSNHLKIQTTLNENGSWTIEINNGVATIKSVGSNTRNWLRFNSQNVIFSSYGSGQQDVCIYIVNE